MGNQQVSVSIDNNYCDEINFLTSRLSCRGAESSSRKFFYISEEEKPKAVHCTEEIILTDLKYKYFLNNIPKVINEPVDNALIFAMMDFDSFREREAMKELMQSSEISIDGIYNFSFVKIKDEWQKLCELIKDFYKNNPGHTEKCDLIAMMLGGFKSQPKAEQYFVSDDPETTALQKVIYYRDKIDIAEQSEAVRKIMSKIFN